MRRGATTISAGRLGMGMAYVVADLGLPELDVLGCDGFYRAGCIDNAGSRRARPNIDADVVVLVGGTVSPSAEKCLRFQFRLISPLK